MKIQGKYDLTELARRAEAVRLNAPGEPAQFRGFDIDNVQSILESCVGFHRDLPEADRRGRIWEALVNAAKGGVVTAASLESALQDAERLYLQRPLVPYVMATSLTLQHIPTLKRRVISERSLTFTAGLPQRFRRDTIQAELDQHTHVRWLARFTTVRVHVWARTENAAFNEALEALDFLRGVWNYWINSGVSMRHSNGPRKPVNPILLGPTQTLHRPSGALATDVFWYQLQHEQFDTVYSPMAKWAKITAFESKVRHRLAEISYERDLRNLLVRYARALDSVDYHVAFNRLWSVLEHLAGAVGDYKALINRVAFLYHHQDRAYVRLLMEHLRDVRNGIVHMDEFRGPMETYLFQLKSFGVEPIVRFHLAQGRRFSSLNTAGQFLDLPTDPELLRERVQSYGLALRFQTPRAR